jgi:hypothetical protein
VRHLDARLRVLALASATAGRGLTGEPLGHHRADASLAGWEEGFGLAAASPDRAVA